MLKFSLITMVLIYHSVQNVVFALFIFVIVTLARHITNVNCDLKANSQSFHINDERMDLT